MVWCNLWAICVNGPYYFRHDQDQHVFVNENCYRSMITEYFWPELDDMDLANKWFQQDGDTIDLLKTILDERVISRNGPVRPVRLFPVKLRQVYGLCQQASDD
uniref:Uncharacterized protein n=1 Tax=Bactrocera dorsalis TaxID=27457 RepID=A0A034VNY2_BACDO